MAKAVPLPRPCLIYGHYTLPDGSIIYPSGSKVRAVRPDHFFAWRWDGWTTDGQGRRAPDGHVLFGQHGIQYFRSPEEAAAAVLREKASK